MMITVLGCDRFGEKECEEFLKKVPFVRQKKAKGYRFLKDRVTSLCVYLLYRHMADIEEEPLFDDRGKPYLPSGKYVSFAHTDGAVACAYSDKNIGCDVQKAVEWETPLAERILTEKEWLRCEQSPDRSRALTEIWALKESYGKYTGEGVFAVLRKTDFSRYEENFRSDGLFYTVRQAGNITCAVCSEREERIEFLSAEEFFACVRRLTDIE